MRLSSNTANNIQGTFSDMHLNHADKNRQEIHKSQEWVCTVRMSRNDGSKQINNKQTTTRQSRPQDAFIEHYRSSLQNDEQPVYSFHVQEIAFGNTELVGCVMKYKAPPSLKPGCTH